MSGLPLPPPPPPESFQEIAQTLKTRQVKSFFVKDSPWSPIITTILTVNNWIIPTFSLQNPPTCYFNVGDNDVSEFPDIQLALKSRIVFMDTDRAAAQLRRGPFHAILSTIEWAPTTTEVPWIDPAAPYEGRLIAGPLVATTHRLWFWESALPPRRALAVDMHMVPADAQAILTGLNVSVDFYFTSDIADILMNAYHSNFFELHHTKDILCRNYRLPLSTDIQAAVRDRKYDFIITGHTIYTTLLLSQLGLPHLHINSTRFANIYTAMPATLAEITTDTATLLRTGRLTVFHNNRADEAYFNRYFPWFRRMSPHKSAHVPSLCEFAPRLRTRSPPGPRRYMFWDPRNQTVDRVSPYISALWRALKDLLGDRLDRTMEVKAGRSHIPDGFQNQYAAIIHIPYNTSTMSMFEQSSAAIPTWVPSRRLLESLWNSPADHNELSWYSFERSKLASQAPPPDRIDRPEVVAAYAARTDFEGILGGTLAFDSAADLLARIDTTDYDAVTAQALREHDGRRAAVYAAYRDFLRHLE